MTVVGILTEEQYAGLERAAQGGLTSYVQNLVQEDGLLRAALERRGVETRSVGWSTPGYDWGTLDAVVVRSTWDYAERKNEFSSFMADLKAATVCINDPGLVEWNLDKAYLLDLKQRGIPITPTYYVQAGTQTTLAQLRLQLGWDNMVLKPATSAGGRHTYRLNPDNLDEHEAFFQKLLRDEAMLLQPFMESVLERGEVSLMIIDGSFTHAVLKLARPGEFRVQIDHGGSEQEYHPGKLEIKRAEAAVAACRPRPLYARVDFVFGSSSATDGSAGDELLLQELELIEPELWFRRNPSSADLLADAILRELQQ